VPGGASSPGAIVSLACCWATGLVVSALCVMCEPSGSAGVNGGRPTPVPRPYASHVAALARAPGAPNSSVLPGHALVSDITVRERR
jgi:hypothetical protein